MKTYRGGDIVCSLVVIMVIIIVYKFIFKQDNIEGFEWMKETDNNAWKNELVKLFGSKGKKYKGNINVTIDGTECRKWKDGDTESIGVPDIDDEAERLKLLGDKDADVSYCRNIGDKMDTPWCITGPGNGMIIPNITSKKECEKDEKTKKKRKWDAYADNGSGGKGACFSDKQICMSNDWSEIREELKEQINEIGDCIKLGKEYITGELKGTGSTGSLMGTSISGTSVEVSPRDCQDRCSGQGECEYFTWHPDGGKCRLFNKNAKGNKNIKDSDKLTFSGAANCATERKTDPNLVEKESEAIEPLPLSHPNASKALEAYNTQIKDRIDKYMKSKVEHVTKKRTCACDGNPNSDDNFNENCSDCKVGYSVHKNKKTGKWECLKDKCFLSGNAYMQDQKSVSGLGCIVDDDIKDIVDWRYFKRDDGKFLKGSKNKWFYDIDQINIDDNAGNGICKVGENLTANYSFISKEDIRVGKCDGKVVGVGGVGNDDNKVFLDKMCVRLNIKGFTFKDVTYKNGEYVYTFIINPVKDITKDSLDLLSKLPKIQGDTGSSGIARIIVSKDVEHLRASMIDEKKNQRNLDKTKPEIIALQELFEFASFGVEEGFSKDKPNDNKSIHRISKNSDGLFELNIHGCKNINFFNKKGCQINNANQPSPNNWRGHTTISSEITPKRGDGKINGFLKNDKGEPWRDNKEKTNKDIGEKKTCKRLLFEEKRLKNKEKDALEEDDSKKTKISDVKEDDMILIKPGTVFPSITNGEKNGFINIMFNIVKAGEGYEKVYILNPEDTICTNQRKIQTTFSIKGNWDFFKTPNSGKKGELRKLGYTGIYDFCYNGVCKLDSNFSEDKKFDTDDMCPKLNRYALTKHKYWSTVPGSNRCNCAIDLESRDVKYSTMKEVDMKDVIGWGSDPYKVCYAKLGVCDAIRGGKKINDKCRGGLYGKPSELNPKGKDRHTDAKCSDEPYGECECKMGWEIDADPDSSTYGLCTNKSTGVCSNNGAKKNRKWIRSESKIWHTGSIQGTTSDKIYNGTKFGEINKKYWVEIKSTDIDIVSNPKNGINKESLFYLWLKDRHFGHYRNPKDHPDVQIVQTYLVDNKNRKRTIININNGVEWLLTYGNNIRGFRNKEAGDGKKWSERKNLRKKLFLYGTLKRNRRDFDFTGDFIISEVPTRKIKPNELWNEVDPYAQPYKSYKKNDMWIHECVCGKNTNNKDISLMNPFTNCACPYGTLLIQSDYKDSKGQVASIPSCKIITRGCSDYGYGAPPSKDSENSWRGIGRQTREQIDGGHGRGISKTASRLNDSERDLKNMGRTIGHFFDYEKKECNFWNDKERSEAKGLVGKGRTIRPHGVAGTPSKNQWDDVCCASCKDKGDNDSWTSIVSPELSKTKMEYPDALIDTANHYSILSKDVSDKVFDPYNDEITKAGEFISRSIGLEPMNISLVKDGWDPINNEKKFMGYGYNSRRVDNGTYSDRKLISSYCGAADKDSSPPDNLKVLDRVCNIKIEQGDKNDPKQAGKTYKYLENCSGSIENVKGSDDEPEQKGAKRVTCKIPIEKLHRKLHYCQKTDFPPLKQSAVGYQDKLSRHGVDPTDRVISYHKGYPSEKCDRTLIDSDIPWDILTTSGWKSLGKGKKMFKECTEDNKMSDAWDLPPSPADYKVAIQTRCHGNKCVDVMDNDPNKPSGWAEHKDISDTLQNDRGYSNHTILGDHDGNHFYFEPRLRYNKGALIWRKEGDVWPGLIGSDWEPGPHAKPGSKEEDCRVGILSNKELLDRGCIPSMSSWGLVGISPGWHESQSEKSDKSQFYGELYSGLGKRGKDSSIADPIKGTGLPISNHNRGSPAGISSSSECKGNSTWDRGTQDWKCAFNATPAAGSRDNYAMAKTDTRNTGYPSWLKPSSGCSTSSSNRHGCAGSTDACFGNCNAKNTPTGKTLVNRGEFGFGGNSLDPNDPTQGRKGGARNTDNTKVDKFKGHQGYYVCTTQDRRCNKVDDYRIHNHQVLEGFDNQYMDDYELIEGLGALKKVAKKAASGIKKGWNVVKPGKGKWIGGIKRGLKGEKIIAGRALDDKINEAKRNAVSANVGKMGKWTYGPPNYGWELKGGMGNWLGYKSMSNGGLSSWNFWTGMGAHRPLGWPGGEDNDNKLDSNFQNWWRKVHQSYFNVHHNREGQRNEGIKGSRLQGLKDMDDIGCAVGDMIPSDDGKDGFDEFSELTKKPGHKAHGEIAMRTLPLHVQAKGPNVGASGGQYGGQDTDKGRAQLSGNAWDWGPKLREIGDIAGGWGQARHVAYGKRPRYLVKTIAPLLSGIGGGEHLATAGEDGWKDYNFRSIYGANATNFERIMDSNNFHHICVKSALRTVGPGRDKSCQLYLNTGSCRPPKKMKGMKDSNKGGTGNWGLKDSRASGTETALGIDCGTVMSGARCLNPAGIKRFEKLDELKKGYRPGKSSRNTIKIDKEALPGSRYLDAENYNTNKQPRGTPDNATPITKNEGAIDMIKLPFSLKERVGSLKTPLHTLYDTPDGGPNWGIMPDDDMTVNKILQRGKSDAEKLRSGNKSLDEGAFKDQDVWGGKRNKKRYDGPDPTGKMKDGTKYNWGGGPLHCGQARLNPACAWGKCSSVADNLPPNLESARNSPTDYSETPQGKGIAGVRPLSAIHQSWGACGWSPGYLGLKPLISSQLKDNEIRKDMGWDCKGANKRCDLPVNSLVDQEKSGGTVNDLSWIHPNITFKGQKSGWVFDRDSVDKNAGGGQWDKENPRLDGPTGEIITLDQFAESRDHLGYEKKNLIFGYHDTKDQLLDHTEDRIMNKEGLVINTIDRQLADGNQCTVSGRESAPCPRGVGTCLVMGGGGYEDKHNAKQRFINQFVMGNDMTAVYDMNNRERCPKDPSGKLKNVPYVKKHAPRKTSSLNNRLSGYGWTGIPYDKNGKRCSNKNKTGRCADSNYSDTFADGVEGFNNEEIASTIRSLNKDNFMKINNYPLYQKLFNHATKSKSISDRNKEYDKKMNENLKKGGEHYSKNPINDGGGNFKTTSSNITSSREGMRRPKHSSSEAFIQTPTPKSNPKVRSAINNYKKILTLGLAGGGGENFENNDDDNGDLIEGIGRGFKTYMDRKIEERKRRVEEIKSTYEKKKAEEDKEDKDTLTSSKILDVAEKMKIEHQPACKIGPLTPIRHVCKSMQPFKWIPDPLEDMDNRAQYFEKSRKVHNCNNVSWNGNGRGTGYNEGCAQAGIHNEPNDSELKLRAQYWDKTYSDKRREYLKLDNKKINALDQIFIENSLDPEKQSISYKAQRDLKAQMVYEDEVRSYYQS